MDFLKENRILIQFDKADFDGAVNAANREAKLRFLDMTGYSGFDLTLETTASNYDYSLDQFIIVYVFKMDLVK